MKPLHPFCLVLLGTSLTALLPLFGQIPVELSVTPARTYGHARQTLNTQEANLVEGRELNAPSGIAIDSSSFAPVT